MKKKLENMQFEIEGLPNLCLSVLYEAEIDLQPIRVEECHGYHSFDDSSLEIKIFSVTVCPKDSGGSGYPELLPKLKKSDIEEIEEAIYTNYEW